MKTNWKQVQGQSWRQAQAFSDKVASYTVFSDLQGAVQDVKFMELMNPIRLG